MARPPIFWGGTCSFSVACDPQIGQLSNKRGLDLLHLGDQYVVAYVLGPLSWVEDVAIVQSKVKKWGGLLGTATG